MEDCRLDAMWKEVLHFFPNAEFISYHDMRTSGRNIQRLKFLPRHTQHLDEYMILISDGAHYCYLVGLDGLLKYEEEHNDV